MFVMKMVFIRDQFKVGPRPDWSLLGPVSSKFYNERSLSFNDRVHSAPPCDLAKSLLVMLGLLEIGSFVLSNYEHVWSYQENTLGILGIREVSFKNS